MRRIFLSVICLVWFTAFSQTKSLPHSPMLSQAPAANAGMSAERLSYIDSIINTAIENQQIPGAIAMVVRNGKIVYNKAFGFADKEANRLLKPDDIFRIASQTKAITSTAVLMLWEKGKIMLDDPIAHYIPEFKNAVVLDSLYADGTYTTTASTKPITIRHLLTHTSGIGYGAIDSDPRFKKIYRDAGITDLFTTEKITIGESVRKLAKLPLHHQPGEKFTYSEGLDVLGYLIEIVSGQKLDAFFRKNIFDPLGMNDTWFYLPANKKQRLVRVQTWKDNTWIHFPVSFYDPEYPATGAATFFSGGAGLSSTVNDYAKFLQMYLNGGQYNGVRILSRKTVELVGRNQIEYLGAKGQPHGLAFGIVDKTLAAKGGQGSEGTLEWGGYFNTNYFVDSKEKLIGIIFKQTQGYFGDQTSNKFRQIVYASIDD